MTGRKIIVLLLGASAVGGAACLLAARRVRCDEIVEQLVRSPDGESVATSTLKACPVGLTTNYSVSVALTSQSQTNKTAVFESADAAEVPTLSWKNDHELVLEVNDIGEVQVSKHEVADVRISYAVPAWVWDRLGTIEADRLRSERESQDLYKEGKLSKDDLRASSEIEDAIAREQSNFRRWIIENATVEGPAHESRQRQSGSFP